MTEHESAGRQEARLEPAVSSRGKAENPQRLRGSDDVIRLKGCPDCTGRGWFLIHPFASGGSNGAGGLSNMTQCLTCAAAHANWKKHQRLPDDIAARMGVDPVTCLPANAALNRQTAPAQEVGNGN